MTARGWGLAITLVAMLGAPLCAQAQTACTLTPDEHNPTEKILRCGKALTVRSAKGTSYELTGQQGEGQQPTGAKLNSGALMIEFEPNAEHGSFQILTPHATAAVRGTKWAMEVVRGQTSTLVVSGAVEVARPDRSQSATLGPGEGADVKAGRGPIVVKRWGEKRVRALLARFGQ